MSGDPCLPIAPARVRALVLPVGQIQGNRFASFLERLQGEEVVHLRDITADGRPNRNMFSPRAFPDGAIFYDLVTHLPAPSHLALSPFDLYREPLVVIAVADGQELGNPAFSKRQSAGGRSNEERNIRALYQELEELRDTYAKVLVHQVLIFDHTPDEENPVPLPSEGMFSVPPVEQSKRTTMRAIMCDISSLLLAEMTTLARSFEALASIDSPGHTSSMRQANGSGWNSEQDPTASRRNSQYSLPSSSRSSSVGGAGHDRSQARMSMPPPSKGTAFGSSSSTPARPSTPVKSGLSNPPVTFDDIANNGSVGPGSPEQSGAQRPGISEDLRTQSQDRVSVQGFGSGGLNDRLRNKGKSRVAIVIGSLYLQAGRWTDALKELIEGGTVAKSINDHIWHGKALDLIVVCLVLLTWAGIEYTVPTICLPLTDKATVAQMQEAENAESDQPKWIRRFQTVLPDLLERVVGLYSRISAEHLPPLPLAEANIRFCKLLAAIHIADGKLVEQSLQSIVLGKPAPKTLTTSPRLTIAPSRSQIAALIFKAFPASASELLTTVDRITILGGIASVLGMLGYERKKAMVIRELISVLIGGLVEARTRGAADVGIHPAAGLVALNGTNGQANGGATLELSQGDIEHGVDAFLAAVLKTYGIVGFDMGNSETDDSDAAAIARIHRQSAARFYGLQQVKFNILRACINFSEALPDFEGVLKYSSDMLRTAGSGVAPGPRREDASAYITAEEQVRLATNISKTTNLAQRLGHHDIHAEYWDEFLVRGVKLEPPATSRVPVEHKKSELKGASTARASQDVDPFIHNSFTKQPDKAVVEHLLVAGEAATFKLTLQNPYDIEVDVESIRLDTQGIEFESAVESTIIGPYRTQILKISGTPMASGPLQITGAIVRIRGCRERRFGIFPQPWAPEREMKIKAIGTGSLAHHLSTPSAASQPLKTEHVGLTVIPEQPVVTIKSTTLPQSSVMILEGERQVFSITLQNLSSTTPVDFLLFSFQDSTQNQLQLALNNRDATPAELYEYELILAKKPALRIKKRGDDRRFIAPGATATFDFEVLGKPGLTSGSIQVDYAHLGVATDDVAAKFYTRQVSLHLTITVNASIEVARMDVLPLHGTVPQALWDRSGQEETGQETRDDYCLLLLDLRNAWPSSMLVQFDVTGGAKLEEHILPGNTNRVIVPLKRIYLDDPHASIPSLNPSRQRQFVVSTGKISPDVERANREAFWYKESILDSLKGTWKTSSGPSSSGLVDLRAMRLTPRMIEAIKLDEVAIELYIEPAAAADKSAEVVHTTSTTDGDATVFVDEFLQFRARITNRTDQPIYPTLRLQPSLCHRPLNVALDFTRKLAWTGGLQQTLPLLPGNGTHTDVVLGVTALCRGEFELTASVEETRLWSPRTEGEKKAEEERKRRSEIGRRPRSETELMMDAALGGRERRIWCARRACRFWVRERG